MKIFWCATARSSVELIWLKRWDIDLWLHSVRPAGAGRLKFPYSPYLTIMVVAATPEDERDFGEEGGE